MLLTGKTDITTLDKTSQRKVVGDGRLASDFYQCHQDGSLIETVINLCLT